MPSRYCSNLHIIGSWFFKSVGGFNYVLQVSCQHIQILLIIPQITESFLSCVAAIIAQTGFDRPLFWAVLCDHVIIRNVSFTQSVTASKSSHAQVLWYIVYRTTSTVSILESETLMNQIDSDERECTPQTILRGHKLATRYPHLQDLEIDTRRILSKACGAYTRSALSRTTKTITQSVIGS